VEEMLQSICYDFFQYFVTDIANRNREKYIEGTVIFVLGDQF
jgi:hypothetical protein